MPLFSTGKPQVIAALHLPPFPASRHPDAQPLSQITEYALRNVSRAAAAGVDGIYIQDLGDTPHAPSVQPYTTAGMAVVGAALRSEFPALVLGVCLMSHGAREPIAIAQSIEASFVRLKVYVGAMVKSEGILQGCAYEAIQYRAASAAEDVHILADVYDRTGEALGGLPLRDEARNAVVFGRADCLVITGKSTAESQEMLAEVRQAGLGVPLLLGGGANAENLANFLPLVDGIIVSTAFKAVGGWSRQSLGEDWDPAQIQKFMDAFREQQHRTSAGES
jgi:uncharacterized protein